jgi:chromate transport protein ChrA
LALSVLVGVLLMSLPNLFGFEGTMGAIDHIFGALIIVNTFIAMAEATRKSRWINIFFGGALAVTALVTFEMPVIHLIAAVGVGVLAIRRGPILEANNL